VSRTAESGSGRATSLITGVIGRSFCTVAVRGFCMAAAPVTSTEPAMTTVATRPLEIFNRGFLFTYRLRVMLTCAARAAPIGNAIFVEGAAPLTVATALPSTATV